MRRSIESPFQNVTKDQETNNYHYSGLIILRFQSNKVIFHDHTVNLVPSL